MWTRLDSSGLARDAPGHAGSISFVWPFTGHLFFSCYRQFLSNCFDIYPSSRVGAQHTGCRSKGPWLPTANFIVKITYLRILTIFLTAKLKIKEGGCLKLGCSGLT